MDKSIRSKPDLGRESPSLKVCTKEQFCNDPPQTCLWTHRDALDGARKSPAALGDPVGSSNAKDVFIRCDDNPNRGHSSLGQKLVLHCDLYVNNL